MKLKIEIEVEYLNDKPFTAPNGIHYTGVQDYLTKRYADEDGITTAEEDFGVQLELGMGAGWTDRVTAVRVEGVEP